MSRRRSVFLWGLIPLLGGCMHHTPGWDDAPSRLLFLGGLFGGFIRAYAGQTVRTGTPWWAGLIFLFQQRWTLWHILGGGALAAICPGVYQWYYRQTIVGPPLFLLLAGFLLGGFGNYILVAVLWRAGIFKGDPRASTPENGSVEKAGSGVTPKTGNETP